MTDFSKYTNPELAGFLRQWGVEFKQLKGGQFNYEACVDGYQALLNQDLKFFENRGKLSQALIQIGDNIEKAIRMKHLISDFQVRADCFKYIGKLILEKKGDQMALF
jgi:hypothetical protein